MRNQVGSDLVRILPETVVIEPSRVEVNQGGRLTVGHLGARWFRSGTRSGDFTGLRHFSFGHGACFISLAVNPELKGDSDATS